MEGLRPTEIYWIISHYIGVSGGYLGDFTYSSHREFYAAYCDLTVDPEDYPGTTRQRFLAVLSSADPLSQAAIVRGCPSVPGGIRGPPDTRCTRQTPGHG